MELRTGAEIEAAGLAAERASPAQVKKVAGRYEAIQAAIERGELAVDQDFAFHCEIGDATGNPQFRRFLEYLGRFIIPRRTVWGSSAPAANRAHLELFQREHKEILRAIEARAPQAARAAMQRHLLNSRARYEKIAAERKAESNARRVSMQNVLVTGAAGDIGTRLRRLLKGVYPRIRWSDLRMPADLAADEEFLAADLADMAQVEKIVAGIDGIVHLGGHSVEGPWPTILNANIIGCYNLFEAAYRAKVERVVFATSSTTPSASTRATRPSASTSRCGPTAATA